MLEIGAKYRVKHRRKGTFDAELVTIDAEFVALRLVGTKPVRGASEDWYPGDIIHVRKSLATFERLPADREEG